MIKTRTTFCLNNGGGCNIGCMTLKEFVAFVEGGYMEDGDTILVKKEVWNEEPSDTDEVVL